MQKIKLTGVYINDTRQDGTPYVTKKGTPFKIAAITWEGGKATKMLFGSDEEAVISKWEGGDTVEVTLTESNGYTNFELPDKTDVLEKRVDKLERVVAKLLKRLS